MVHGSECVTKKVGRLDSVRISEIHFYPIYRLTGATVVQQLNLVLVFERYETSTYVCEFVYWILLIGLLKLVKLERKKNRQRRREEKEREREGGHR